ncbi:MAG: 5-oxoprolinase subunit PxpA [Ferruginibacter sp.]
MKQVDINCDTGEGSGNESLLMPFISSANIACGYHSGSESEMKRLVDLCLQNNVAIGAHPSFPDKNNFGRTEMILTTAEIRSIVLKQLDLINNIVRAAGAKLHHIKPHGALYNMAAKDSSLAKAMADSVNEFDSSLIYYGLSGSVMIEEAIKVGLQVAREVFADRTYQSNGSLTPRSNAGALLTNAEESIIQVMQMITEGNITAVTGERINIDADTICIHGDGPQAIDFAKQIYHRLTISGIRIKRINKTTR